MDQLKHLLIDAGVGAYVLAAWIAAKFGFSLGIETLAHLPHALYGALIIMFLLIEPLGLGKIYGNIRDYLLVWPFGYVKK